MNNKKIELIYEMIIGGVPLTDETLKRSGFSALEIIELLKERVIIPTETNEYKLFSVVELYYYGIRILLTASLKKAYLCFEKCHQLDRENRDICLQMLLLAVKRGNYIAAFEWFSKAEKINSEKYRNDNNLYLYLLSGLTRCPDKYAARLHFIDYDSILIPHDKEHYNKEKENAIRQSIMKNKKRYALRLLNDLLEQEPIYLIHEVLLKELLLRTIAVEMEFNSKILSLAQQKQYSEIINLLDIKRRRKYLSNDETYIYLISKAIINLLQTQTVPEITVYQTDSIYEAIRGNNFKLALRRETRFVRNFQKTIESNVVETLLVEINRLIYEIKSQQHFNTSSVLSVQEEPVSSFEKIKQKKAN